MNLRTIPPVGLRNYGANCYVNAGLQCMLCVPEMNAYFVDEQYLALQYECKSKRMSTCKDLTTLYKNMVGTGKGHVDPSAFTHLCPPGQQDTHEFYWKKLFPHVQDETNPKVIPSRRDGWNSSQSWKWYRTYHKSVLDYLFGGQFESRVSCDTCGNVSCTYDLFLDISLAANHKTLETCLAAEFQPENLPSSVGYICETCRKVRSITKSMKIDKAPKYLFLHLKRLVGGGKKISSFIQYPMRLNVTP